MEIFNLQSMKSYPYKERTKNIFYKTKEFKTRVIELAAGEKMRDCKMESYVIFYIVSGSAIISVNEKKNNLKEDQCLITEPATLSITTKHGVKIMGVQIKKF